MAKFKGAVLTCVTCGAEFKVPPCRAETASTCSNACAVAVRAKSRERKGILTCKTCKKDFTLPRCHADRQLYCSRACMHADPDLRAKKSVASAGARNHMWKGGLHSRQDGYIYASAPGHPFASNGYVLEHRLVMEKWLVESTPDSLYLVRVKRKLRLSPAFHVHHIDEDRTNNAIDNLMCMSPGDHQRLHNAIRRAARAPT